MHTSNNNEAAKILTFEQRTLLTSVLTKPTSARSMGDGDKDAIFNPDVVQQIHSNLLALEDLQSRFEFLLREVKYQLKV